MMLRVQAVHRKKRSFRKKLLFSVFVVTALTFCGFYRISENGFSINLTSSMPRGIYRIVSKQVERGDVVGACVPDIYVKVVSERGYLGAGSCPSGLRPVMKFVAAVGGDLVEVRTSGVSVNEVLIPNTKVFLTDALGRSMFNQLGKHQVASGEFWLISNTQEGSFDSRYFGPVNKLLGVVKPLLTLTPTKSPELSKVFLRIGENRQ